MNAVSRNAGAQWFIPTENEWYKAAYHQPAGQGGDADDYWVYPTRTNSEPYSDQPPGSDAPTQSNTANFYHHDAVANNYNDGYAVTGSTGIQSGNTLTDVGAYTLSTSPYGTFDQGGNVREWNETLRGSVLRGVRGAPWNGNFTNLQSSYRPLIADPRFEFNDIGFRIATVPEPSTMLLFVVGTAGIFGLRRRLKRSCFTLATGQRATA